MAELYDPSNSGYLSVPVTDERKGVALGSDVLANVLTKLDEVMAEAERLRQHVTRQLANQRAGDRQTLTPARKRKRARKR